MVSKGQFMGLDWNRITWLHSQVTTGTYELTNSLGARIFSEFSKHLIYHVFVVSSLIYSLWRLVGCILICFNVTA